MTRRGAPSLEQAAGQRVQRMPAREPGMDRKQTGEGSGFSSVDMCGASPWSLPRSESASSGGPPKPLIDQALAPCSSGTGRLPRRRRACPSAALD